ncbi:hypothetical protein M9H77_18575 [Catharanthus roseus]|uniref:Uncharacterized protein n=1 Tax=Catharanthus roseus TaxID=4058 RepID=A0ACC0B7Z6_CATRO|nr:hypothetical protein M9H77_18575 [Catharanthus roseus]
MEEIPAHVHPGPIVPDVLTRQHEHRSDLIWSGDHEMCIIDLQCRSFGRNLFQAYSTVPRNVGEDDDDKDHFDEDYAVSSESDDEEDDISTPINHSSQWFSIASYDYTEFGAFLDMGSEEQIDDLIESGTIKLLDWNDATTDIQLGMRFTKEHTYLVQVHQNKHRNMSSKFISRLILYLVANDPAIPISNVIQEVQVLLQTGCTYKRAWVWTSQVLHFGVKTTNCAESEHSVLKLWLSTCHGDLDTVFLNINSLIQAQIAEIKYSLEISILKEKYGAKSNPIVNNLCNKISHLGLKKIIDELKKARQMVEESDNNCLHYLRKSHGLPYACELVNRCQHLMPIQEEDVVIFWRKLEIGSDIPEEHHRDMESEMRDLTSLLHEISTGPMFNPLSTLPETAVTKGRRKTNSTKKDKSHWEYVSINYRKIGKSSGSGSGSGSDSGSRSNPSPHGRGRPPRSSRSKDRGRSSDRSSLSTVSTTVLPLVSNMDGPSGMIFIGLVEELQHFIQVDVQIHMAHRVQVFVTDGDEGEVEI